MPGKFEEWQDIWCSLRAHFKTIIRELTVEITQLTKGKIPQETSAYDTWTQWCDASGNIISFGIILPQNA